MEFHPRSRRLNACNSDACLSPGDFAGIDLNGSHMLRASQAAQKLTWAIKFFRVNVVV